MKERILVAGGGGFVGSHVARELFRQGYFVRIVDVRESEYMREKYYDEMQKLDLRVWENCLIATKGIDRVYNFAANMGGIGFLAAVGAEVMHDNIIINTHMLEASRLNQIERYLFSSSACVYPIKRQRDTEVRGLRERDVLPAHPDTFYGWEKLFTEKICEAYERDYGMQIRIVRYHNVYGPEGTYKGGREKAPASICRKVAEASDPGKMEIWGDGKQTRSFCYISDCVEGTNRLMNSDHDKPINIGSDRLVSIDEMADIVIKISGKKIRKVHDRSAPQGVRGRNADITLAKKILDWSPKVSLENGLAETYEWIKTQV